MRELIQQNLDRGPVYLYGTAGDELEGYYEVAPRGLLLAVYKYGQGPRLDALLAENDDLWEAFERRWAGNLHARASWQSVLRLDYALPSFVLGLRYQNARRYDEAVALYELSVRLSPEFAPPLANLGDVYWNGKRDPAKALPYLERFLALQPYSHPAPQVREDVAGLRIMLGR